MCTAGAVLTHNSLIADSAGVCALLPDYNPGDRHISYLPLAHIYERVNVITATHLGGCIGFYSGNVLVRSIKDATALSRCLFLLLCAVVDLCAVPVCHCLPACHCLQLSACHYLHA